MQGSDQLLTIAELAIGLAGFSGVVVAFAYRERLQPLDRLRFLALLSIAAATVILSFVPLSLHSAGLFASSLWRASSSIAIAVWIAQGLVFVWPLRRAALKYEAAAPPAAISAFLALSTANLIIQAANALGWPFGPSPLPYIAGLLIAILCAVFIFAFLVLLRPKGPGA